MKISCNFGFFGLLTIAFVVLKLCGVISWPWLAVCLPILVPVIISICIFAVLLFVNSKIR